MLMTLEALKDVVSLNPFGRLELLEAALSDTEYIAEDPFLTPSQKRLRTLEHINLVNMGSMVFSTLVSNYLCDRCFELGQATLSLLKSDLIATQTLSKFAEQLNFRELCCLGTNYTYKPEHEQKKILAQNLEAVVGAVYLEFNRDICRTQTWLREYFLQEAVDDLLVEREN
ncbi:MAG: ribonuclease III domain-containing protein [Cyanobacteria bacterium J06592_8]